ncbi:MAG: hypothetical protein IJW59_03385 [Clostridia bacterium]|nr:hypothetical protein [Clostridia bacterium]
MTIGEYEELIKKSKKKALNGLVWTSVSGLIFVSSMINLAINGGYSDDYKDEISACLSQMKESDAFEEYKEYEIAKLEQQKQSGVITSQEYESKVKSLSSLENVYNNRKQLTDNKSVEHIEGLVENYKEQFGAEAISLAGTFVSTGILTYGGSKFALNADKVVSLMERKKELEQETDEMSY